MLTLFLVLVFMVLVSVCYSSSSLCVLFSLINKYPFPALVSSSPLFVFVS